MQVCVCVCVFSFISLMFLIGRFSMMVFLAIFHLKYKIGDMNPKPYFRTFRWTKISLNGVIKSRTLIFNWIYSID